MGKCESVSVIISRLTLLLLRESFGKFTLCQFALDPFLFVLLVFHGLTLWRCASAKAGDTRTAKQGKRPVPQAGRKACLPQVGFTFHAYLYR